MLLTIVIPHYNLAQELLKRCIDSIIALHLPAEEHEIIVVDDGSATPPRWITTTYPGTNIRLEEHTHGGLGSARNHGIEAAKGTFIQFVDADDTLHNNNTMQQCIEVLKHEHPDILRFRYKLCDDSHNTSSKKEKAHFGNTISGAIFMAHNNLPGSACCYFIKKSFLDKKEIRFSTNTYHEDEEFSTIAHFHAQALIESDAHIYNYHTRADSIVHNSSVASIEKRLNDCLKITEQLATFKALTHEHSNSIQKKGIKRKLTTLAVDFIVNNLYAGKKGKDIHDACKKHLTPLMLYPIARGNYGIKFKIFRILANSRIGLQLLRLLVPTRYKTGNK